MDRLYEPGDSIEFMLPDKKGKPNWFPGKIHGVKRIEDPRTNMILNVSYLVDTGRDEYTAPRDYDVRDVEVDKRVKALIKAGKKTEMAAKIEVYAQSDLPASKIVTEIFRQPEQIELPESAIRKA